MSIIKEKLLEKFSQNKSHRAFCNDCFETTASIDFWIFDPADDDVSEKKYPHILMMPNSEQRKTSIRVSTEKSIDRTFLALDNCFFKSIKDAPKCEGVLFSEQVFIWIELKMNSTSKSPNTMENRVEDALNQIILSKKLIESKEIDLSGFRHFAHVGIPNHLEELAAKSDLLTALTTRLRKKEGIKLTVKSVLELKK